MVTTYRYAEPREGPTLRIGVTRQPPRGIRRQDYRKKGFFDLWLRVLAPSSALLTRYRKSHITFREFKIGYLAEMSRVEPRQVIAVLALFSRSQPLSIGCYCKQEDLCHRSVLRQLIEDAGRALPEHLAEPPRPSFSSVCYAEEPF